MNVRRIFVFCFLALLSFGLHAGAGHSHGHEAKPISKDKAEAQAVRSVAQLVSKGKLEQSWTSSTLKSSQVKQYKSGPEWMVVFVNDKISDKAKSTLYVFLSATGKYIAANHTGQ